MAGGTVMGIDIGTTSVKAGLMGADGRVRAAFSAAHPTARPAPGIAEQDPDGWLALVREAIDRLAPEAGEVAAIGLCGQVNTHVFVGADGAPLMPAILWQDVRAAPEAAELDARASAAEREAWWGAPMPIDASHPLARMLWCARHRPEIWERTRHVMLPRDYVLMRLTGEAATDAVSNVGLAGPDLRYAAGALALVPGAAERTVPLAGMTEAAGEVRGGPLAGTPVVTGTMDAWAGLVGAGGAREGAAVYLSGTSEVLGIAARRVVPTPGIVVFPEAQGVHMHAAPTQSGGDAQAWLAGTLGLKLEAIPALVAASPPGAATPLFLPQLEGERAPLWDATLRGAFLGLTRRTGPGDMARAVYEGVAFSARHALGALRRSAGAAPAEITCGGGGFRSAEWAQVRADALGVPLRLLAEGEPGVLGAAALAAVGAGFHADLASANEALVRRGDPVEPRAAERARMDDLFALYVQAIGANAELGRALARIGGDRA